MLKTNKEIERSKKFFQIQKPIAVFLTSQARWIKIYQFIVIGIVIGVTMNNTFLLNAELFGLSKFTIAMVGMLAFYSGMYLVKMMHNLNLISANLRWYWVWMLLYVLVIIAYSVIARIATIEKLIVSRDFIIELSLIHFLCYFALSSLFWIWLYIFEADTKPYFQKAIFYKFLTLVIMWIIIGAAFSVYQTDTFTSLRNYVLNLSTKYRGLLGFLVAVPVTLYGGFSITYLHFKKKIQPVPLANVDTTKILSLGVILSTSIWYIFFDRFTSSRLQLFDWIFLAICITITALFVFLFWRGRNEIRSMLTRNTLIIMMLLFVWVALYVIVTMFFESSNSSILYGIAGLTSSLLILTWVLFNVKGSPFFNVFLSLTVTIIDFSLTIIAIINYFNLTIITRLFPVDEFFALGIIFVLVLTLSSLSLRWSRILNTINKRKKNVVASEVTNAKI